MIIGIDPGVKGGMALLTDLGGLVDTVSFEGFKAKELAAAFRIWRTMDPRNIVCWIEKVGYIKGDGAQGSFTFGRVAGLLEGISLGNDVEPHYVYPVMWQSYMNCLTGGNKQVSRRKAIEMFPTYHAERPRGITLGIADAILIAEYGRRMGLRG